MRINFKTIVIIFLVALLGASIGTYGVFKLYIDKNKPIVSEDKENVIINEVAYTNKKETNYTKAIEKAYNSVVEIKTTVKTNSNSYFYFNFGENESYSTATGSGVIISQDGYIVTNEHVISGASDENAVSVILYNGEQYQAKIIGYDTRTDLALLKIDEYNLPYSMFVDSSKLQMGEDVIAIGNPLGLGISCSNGIISALEKEIYINNVYITVLQTNAAVNAGNSGGGLFDINGNIVGIVNAKKSSSFASETSVEGLGYAIPSNTVIKVVEELKENGFVKDRAALGVRVYTGNTYYSSSGVMISEVIENSSADKAGLKENDIIIAIDDIVVNSYADLSKILDTKSVGDIVKVRVNRDGKSKDINVTLQQSSN